MPHELFLGARETIGHWRGCFLPKIKLRLHSNVEKPVIFVKKEWQSMKCFERGQFYKIGYLAEDSQRSVAIES